jgi:long-chain acyl-CoA synthetase
VTYRQLDEQSNRIAQLFRSLGLQAGDHVAIFLENNPRFFEICWGAQRSGLIYTAISSRLTAAEVDYIVTDCGAKVAFVDEALLPLWTHLRDRLDLAVVVVVGAVGSIDGCITFEELLQRGRQLLGQGGGHLDEIAAQVMPEDTATIIYTSGTTGPPKGAVLTHEGLLFSLRAVLDIMAAHGSNLPRAKELGLLDANGAYHYPPGAPMVSYLPLAHIAERIFSFYTAQHVGGRVRFVRDLTTMAQVLPQVRPLGFLAVPRVWEKLHSAIVTKLQGESGLTRALGLHAVEVARRRGLALLEGRRPGLLLTLQHACFERIVYSKLREAVGLDRTVLGLTGAAPIAKDLLATWIGFGVMISEAFGMTETHAIIAFTPPGLPRAGTVGRPIPGVETKVADDGELLVRGGNIFAGYLNLEAATREALQGGWLHTGDLVEVTDEGYLTVIGRKKELIITAGGKNLSPNNIEEAIRTKSPIIGQMLVHGDAKPYVSALVVLDPEAFSAWAQQHGVVAGTLEEAAVDPRVRAEVERAVQAGNAELSNVEQVKRWTVLGQEWTPDSGELTATMKLKRDVVQDRYRDQIEAMYP